MASLASPSHCLQQIFLLNLDFLILFYLISYLWEINILRFIFLSVGDYNVSNPLRSKSADSHSSFISCFVLYFNEHILGWTWIWNTTGPKLGRFLVHIVLVFASAGPQEVLPRRDSFIFLAWAFSDQMDIIHSDSRPREQAELTFSKDTGYGDVYSLDSWKVPFAGRQTLPACSPHLRFLA